jgi:mannobiose 2-epimerase
MLNKQEVIRELKKNILPFWQSMADEKNGGFYGEADFYGSPNKTADKGCILNSRILWTFSSAYRLLGDDAYRTCAQRSHDYLKTAFWDEEHGGLFWLVDHTGKAPDTRKQFYNIAFGIYALSEYYRAVGDQSSLALAEALFDVTERYGFDPAAGGYIEACSREWGSIDDFRLSGKDLNCPKSMNTNLHILEAYTNMVLASGDERVRKALKTLIHITLDKIINHDWHFELFFDMDWHTLAKDISYGHDIEGSWLLYEAALAVGEENLISKVKQTALEIAEVTYTSAIDHTNGGLFSGCDTTGYIHAKKEWWQQAEAIAGFYNAYKLSDKQKYLDAANSIWNYIQNYFVDYTHNEWHNELNLDNTPDTSMPKAGFWKCPYHNARACLEIIRRIEN